MFRELAERDSIFDLPRRKFHLGSAELDTGVSFHGRRAGSPLGPAAGPQTQMAQNLVLSWLGGCRIMELKTVQVMDELEIPRPCIDMQTIGFNVEWSQELKLEQSLEEYVKGSMLIEILEASGEIEVAEALRPWVFDMSVGYDLAGIQTERVQAFIDGMLDASAIVERLRGEIPAEHARFRDLDFRTRLSDTLTLSTFHGCPPDEIERIIEFLLDEKGLHCIVKLNPMLLGPRRCRELLNGEMGYGELHVPDTAFERDASWEQAAGFCERLGDRADRLGLGFGVKFSNTLIVENHREFFPRKEKEMYLSGPPLHVLAVNLVGQFRRHFGDRFPISFSAGIDAQNFADAVAIGLVPITVCSDLLKPGGYARATTYLGALETRMKKLGAPDVPAYILRAYGRGDEALARAQITGEVAAVCRAALESGGDLRAAAGEAFEAWVSAAILANTEHYVAAATADPRYRKEKNDKPPRKLGSELELFDCVACNKCVPVCPNHANFAFAIPTGEVPIAVLSREGDRWRRQDRGTLAISKKQQWGTFADFCNECGNCDVFCPEDGGPYVIKPRFFGNLADWEAFADQNGFLLHGGELLARIGGAEYRFSEAGGRVRFAGAGFDVTFSPEDPAATIEGEAVGEIDLTYFHILRWIRDAVYASGALTYPALLAGGEGA
jgi:putative selenate reductase